MQKNLPNKKLYFLTCCGSGEAEKDGKFGYMGVFKKVEQLAGDAYASAQALPVVLLTPESQGSEPAHVMQTRVHNENFTGKIKEYYTAFIQKLVE